jgi:hypothetical protein
VIVVVLAIAALWLLPTQQVKNASDDCYKASLENEARKTTAQILGGAAVWRYTAKRIDKALE